MDDTCLEVIVDNVDEKTNNYQEQTSFFYSTIHHHIVPEITTKCIKFAKFVFMSENFLFILSPPLIFISLIFLFNNFFLYVSIFRFFVLCTFNLRI